MEHSALKVIVKVDSNKVPTTACSFMLMTTRFASRVRNSQTLNNINQQRQAGDPESTALDACPLSVHKNGGAR